MKKIIPFLFMLLATTAVAQNKDYLLSTEGIGALKLGMSLPELEKLLKTKITLKVINVDSVVLVETINVKYKGIDVSIDLWKRQDNSIVIEGMSTSSPLCKTNSGIGIGSSKLQIIAAFEGYFIEARPDYEYINDKPVKNKTKSTVTVKEDSEGYAILFYLVNNKVVSFEIFPDYDDEE